MSYVYILRCRDNSLYTGWTTDIERRVKEHNKGVASKYTRSRLPAKLVYIEELPTKIQAMKRESAIKKLSKNEKEHLVAKMYT